MVRRRSLNEVIVTGRPQDVEKLLAKAAGQGMGQKRGMQISHKQRTVALGLVRAQGKAASDMLGGLAKLAGADRLAVAMEPNCVVGNPYTQELHPWDWELGPWDWELGPWDWELGNNFPRVIAAGATPAEGESLFWSQPALRQIGLTDAAGRRMVSLETHTGAGVLVGVFDAIPAVPVTLPWLTIHPAATALEVPDDVVDRDLSDHGLMCASLVHAVAPSAELHLYEVCTRSGYGTLFPLLEALNSFVDMAAGRPAVISLSLGSLCAAPLSPALTAVLQRATDLGMVVCAASGNKARACSKVSNLLPAMLPAALPNVIAVSAASQQACRSTFSQRGDIAAPGGEGLGDPGPGDADDIIGMGVSNPAGQASGYVRMDGGTSFATPLVAGAAVLVLARQPVLDSQTYVRVLTALRSAATPPTAGGETLSNSGLGAGVISLTGLLA